MTLEQHDRAQVAASAPDTPNASRSSLLDLAFAPFDKFCLFLGKYFSYFAPKTLEYRLFADDFQPETSDERGNFIPVRTAIIVEKLLEPWTNDPDAYRKRADFARIGAARFHYESLDRLERLQESFAPFDPDADSRYEKTFSPEQKREALETFTRGLEDALNGANYDEIPRAALARLLKIALPWSLPVEADYGDFLEYRLFARGIVDKPLERKSAWRGMGQTISVSSQTISRLCVYARLKRGNTKFERRIKKLREKFLKSEDELRDDDEILILKLFKNVDLEDLKMASPKVKMKFQPFDFVKIWGSFAAGSGSAVVKFILAATFNLMASLAFMFGFLLLALRNLFKFVNRRTAYLQRFANQLYFHTLASNFAAANALVVGAEEQEIKEFLLGYFTTLARGDWSTEREIDEDAEAFLRDRFGLEVDFESADALRKMREKRLLEEREDVEPNGERVLRYRVKPLDDALRILDEDWDNFFTYNV